MIPSDRAAADPFGVTSFLKALSWSPLYVSVGGGVLAMAVKLLGSNVCDGGVHVFTGGIACWCAGSSSMVSSSLLMLSLVHPGTGNQGFPPVTKIEGGTSNAPAIRVLLNFTGIVLLSSFLLSVWYFRLTRLYFQCLVHSVLLAYLCVLGVVVIWMSTLVSSANSALLS